MRSLLLLFTTLIWLGIASTAVFACTCAEQGTPVCAAYWRSDAVFVGQLRDITPPPQNIAPRTLPTATLHFIVEQPFRGLTAATVDVEVFSGTSCDAKWDKGKRYLIYANRNSESGPLFAGPCSRTNDLRYADEDLAYIRSVLQQGATESVAGLVARNKYEPVSGVKIEVRQGSRKLETSTDEKGKYSVSLPGAGSYTVRLLVPSSVSVLAYREDLLSNIETTDALTTMEYEVKLGKGECDYREFDLFHVNLHATAEISGVVLTVSGNPVVNGTVNLLKGAEDTNRFNYTQIKADGSFKFEGVAPGEYLLVLNPDNNAPDKDDPPYGRSFYPNASDASGATKIVVTEAAKLENLVLRVGPAWKARTVSGKVVREDGGPITNAHVSLYDGQRYIRMVEVDKEGRFSFQVYGDFKYAIRAEMWSKVISKSDRVALTDKSTNLTLVLKLEK